MKRDRGRGKGGNDPRPTRETCCRGKVRVSLGLNRRLMPLPSSPPVPGNKKLKSPSRAALTKVRTKFQRDSPRRRFRFLPRAASSERKKPGLLRDFLNAPPTDLLKTHTRRIIEARETRPILTVDGNAILSSSKFIFEASRRASRLAFSMFSIRITFSLNFFVSTWTIIFYFFNDRKRRNRWF